MVKQVISTGTTANDGTGDTLRSAGTKINENFTELYNRQVLVTETQTTSSLGINNWGTLTFTSIGKAYGIQDIRPDRAAYIKVYRDSASHLADSASARIVYGDSAPFKFNGLITECVTKSDSAMKITPMAMGYTDSQDAYGNVRVAVQNQSAGAAAVAVTIKALKLSL